MANPTLPVLMSRMLVLDQGIDYEIKNKKRRGKKSDYNNNNKNGKNKKLKRGGRKVAGRKGI